MKSRSCNPFRILSRIALLLLVVGVGAQNGTAQATGAQVLGRRVALVIGNGVYQSNPLKNPPNDADDVAAALQESGFEVQLLKNTTLEVFERAVNDFTATLKGADTGLFYYAGHGVAVDGMNYLIPVSPRIDDVASVKSRAVAVDSVIGKMEATGVRTTLVFLDSCRDNPFPGAARTGTRGLAVVAAPKTVNSLIAYATSPGETALDGGRDDRNGIFSGALIRQLREPGLELTVMMRNVKSEVAAISGNKQQPRVDDGMKEPFFFISIEAAAAKAQAALDKSKSELASLDAKLADLQRQIASSNDAQARQKLQLEQQRQQALQQAKALEADNLAKEAAKQKVAAEAAAKLSAERLATQAANAKAQNDLSQLASARRAELDRLAQAGASDNPDILIDTVERLEVVLKEVDGQYAAALQRSLDASNAGWDKQLTSFSGQEPDITETDAEFNARIAREKSDLEGKRRGELAALRQNIEAQRLSQTATMRTQYYDTLRTLQTKVWTVTGSGAILTIGTFDRNTRIWPFTVASADPTLPMVPIDLVATLGTAPDPKAAILALNAAVQVKALAAEFDWGIARDTINRRYTIDVRTVRVRNLTTNEVVAQANPNQKVAYFVAGKRTDLVAYSGTLTISGNPKDGTGDVYIDGMKVGSLPFRTRMVEKAITVEVRWSDAKAAPFSRIVTVHPGTDTAVVASKSVLNVGDVGPAGGIIFYDKGKISDGWRYLEAAPTDQSTDIQWYNGINIGIKTGIAIGTGRANTAAIIAAQGRKNYAATLCRNLTINGFSDWFLPSKDELSLMYTNLMKAGHGGFTPKLNNSWYWSSTEYNNNLAWAQNFNGGYQDYNDKYDAGSVRAVRAF